MAPRSPISISFKVSVFSFALVVLILALNTPIHRAAISKLPSLSLVKPKIPHQLAITATTTAVLPKTAPKLKITKRPWNVSGHPDLGKLYTHFRWKITDDDGEEEETPIGTYTCVDPVIRLYLKSRRASEEHEDKVRRTGNEKEKEEEEEDEDEDPDDPLLRSLHYWPHRDSDPPTPLAILRNFQPSDKLNRLVRIIVSGPELSAEERKPPPHPMGVHADLNVFASLLEPGRRVVHEVQDDGPPGRKVYLHVLLSEGRVEQPAVGGAEIEVEGVRLREGEGGYVEFVGSTGRIEIGSVGEVGAEVLVFDMGE